MTTASVALPDGEVLLLGLGAPRVGATPTTLWGTLEDPVAEWYLARGPEHEVFARYGEQLATRLGRREARAGSVWCSWYSNYEDLSEDLIAETLDGVDGLPFDVFQLDDGWEPIVGDWVANSRLRFKSTSGPASWLTAEERARLDAWLRRTDDVEQLSRYSFRVGDRILDLTSFTNGYDPSPSTTA